MTAGEQRTTTAPTQLLMYAFDRDAVFEGALVGALERLESGGALRVLDALFVIRDAATGEISAIEVRSRGAGSFVSPALGFRLDAAERRRTTERTMRSDSGSALGQLGRTLAPGAAVAAVLVEHVWAGALEEAVSRTGGTPVADAFVEATTLADITPDLLAAAWRT